MPLFKVTDKTTGTTTEINSDHMPSDNEIEIFSST
jgi:hypothetical protein